MNATCLAVVLALMVFTATSLAEPRDDQAKQKDQEDIKKYLAIMETIDVDLILNNTRLLNSNIKCFLNEGPCTAQFKEVKKMLPMLVKDSCMSCTKKQKEIVKKSINALQASRPKDYDKLRKIYDPEEIYAKKFFENLNQ